MTRRALIASGVVAATLTAAPRLGAAGSSDGIPYEIGGAIGYGNAEAPPEVSRGLTTSLRIVERNGPIGMLLLAGLGSRGMSNRSFGADRPLVDAPVHQPTFNAVMGGGYSTVFELELPLRQLGGDVTGFAVQLRWGLPSLPISAGVLVAFTTAHDRTRRLVALGGATITTTETIGDVDNDIVGLPLRLALPIGRFAAAYVQADLNLLSLTGGYDARNLSRYGLEVALPHLRVEVELRSAGLSPGAATLQLGATLGF